MNGRKILIGTASNSRQDHGQLSFQYSPSGNIDYNTRVGSYTYTGPQPHAVTSAGSNTYSYDLNGNMTNRNGQAMAYDQENRMVQAGSYSYVYNYKGMRAVKNGGTPSSTTSYFNKYWECTNGACTKHIFAGSQRIASNNGSGAYYYQPDHLGGLNVATDGSGNLAETNFYYPYGEDWIKTGSVDLHYKFTDQENDPETGVYYYKARYYDPVIGRFVSPDPMVQAAYDPTTFSRLSVHRYLPNRPPVYALSVRTGHLLNNFGGSISNAWSQVGINPYTYVQNNPIGKKDPLGLDYTGDSVLVETMDNDFNSGVGSAYINALKDVMNRDFTVAAVASVAPALAMGAAVGAVEGAVTLEAAAMSPAGRWILTNGVEYASGAFNESLPWGSFNEMIGDLGWRIITFGFGLARDYFNGPSTDASSLNDLAASVSGNNLYSGLGTLGLLDSSLANLNYTPATTNSTPTPPPLSQGGVGDDDDDDD
ncbi:MAG: RHS repeat-associated core domain-containing protein [Syntrophobacteraceae bacterium]|jgi:RHS repeat-associated protein